MEIAIPALIGIGLAAMFFGYFFGLFEGRAKGYKKRRKEEASEPLPSTLPPSPSGASASTKRSLLELHVNEGGHPEVLIDGRAIDARRVSPEERRRLIDLMVMLRPWVERGSSTQRELAGSSSDAPQSAPSTVKAGAPVGPAQTGAAAPTPAPAASPTSLVAQIDSVLQARLAGTPLAQRGIRLTESLHGGAIVFVGSQRYDGVDQVPDAAIQDAIRKAIEEWERKFPPR